MVVIAIKESLFRFVLSEADSVDSSAIKTDAWHHRSDAITSFAAAVGITVSLVGGPAYAPADDVAAIVAAVIIAFNGIRLLRPALDELMDATPNRVLLEQIRETAGTIAGVERVEKCFARKMGHLYFVDMHIEVAPAMTVAAGHEISHKVKDRVREKFPAVQDVLVHIEPGKADAERKYDSGSAI